MAAFTDNPLVLLASVPALAAVIVFVFGTFIKPYIEYLVPNTNTLHDPTLNLTVLIMSEAGIFVIAYLVGQLNTGTDVVTLALRGLLVAGTAMITYRAANGFIPQTLPSRLISGDVGRRQPQ